MSVAADPSDVSAFTNAVAAAIVAPSVHNTQPWQFVRTSAGLEVWADPLRRLPVLDPSGRQQCISIGCAVLNARVSLAAAGHASVVERLPEPQEPQLMARISLAPDGADDPELAALEPAVLKRQTNRRHFRDEDVPETLIARLVRAAEAEQAELVRVVSDGDRRLIAELWQEADRQQLIDPAYRAELRAWTTTDPDRRDGVPARAVPHVDAGSRDELPIRDFDTQGEGWLPTETHSGVTQCLLILGTPDDDPLSWLRAGEALQRAWLELTRAGFVASLFTQAIEVSTLRTRLRTELRLPFYPHVLLRIGRAPITPATSRRAIGDMFRSTVRSFAE